MTAKEAVLSLMSKDPSNPTIKALKKNGMLKEILYSDQDDRGGYGRDQGGERGSFDRRDRDEMMGREGGRSVRSIAKDRDSRGRGELPQVRGEGGTAGAGQDQDEVLGFNTDGWGTKRPQPAAREEVMHLPTIYLPANPSMTYA